MGRRVGGLLVLMLLTAAIGASCKAKKPVDLSDEGAPSGIAEEGLGPGAGSLAQARAGTLGKEAAAGPLADIQFAYDSFELEEDARRVLQRSADWLKQNPNARIEIEGHCDERGTVEYNLALGAKRASAAKSYLSALGIDDSRMTTISYGEELPLCHEHTEGCWQRNRRAHFVVITD